MRKLIITAIIVCIASPALADKPVKTARKKLKADVVKVETEEQKTLYAIGQVIARQLTSFKLTPAELRIVKEGLTDGVRGRKPRVDYATYSRKSREMGIARRDAHGRKLEAMAPAFIEAAAGEQGAVKSKSGVVYLSLREGEGAGPAPTERIRVHYRSSLIDDRQTDSTYERGEPEEAKVSEFVKCLNEGVQMMKPGGRARLVCPPETVLGKEGFDHVPPNATLVYDVELVEIVKESAIMDGRPEE